MAFATPKLQTVRTRYYLIHSDLDDALLYDLGLRLDSMYAEYSRRMADFALKTDRKPLDVYLFARKADYTQFTGGKHPNTGGVYMPARNQLAAYLEGQRDALRRTLQHEAFHQFAHKAIGGEMPVWLNEGMAQLFEEGIWSGRGFLLAQVPPRRVRQLQNDQRTNRLLPLKKLMGFSPVQWGTNLAADPTLGATQYNQSWALVHYMAYGDDGANGSKLVKMLMLLSRGAEAQDAFEDAYGRNMETFKGGFENYISRLTATAEATLIDRHEVLADLCAQLAQRGTTFKDVEQYRKTVEQKKYKLQYTRGQLTWTAEPALYFRDGAGQPWSVDQLFFQPRTNAALPDLVFKDGQSRLSLRARFFRGETRIEHEVLIDRSGTTASVER